MADVTLTYKGTTIAELNDSGSKTIRTAGKFCKADIGVEYVKPSGGIIPTGTKKITITENGATTEDVTNYANAQITVNVPSSGGVISGILKPSAETTTYTVDVGTEYDKFLFYLSPNSPVAQFGNGKRVVWGGLYDRKTSKRVFYLGSNVGGTAWTVVAIDRAWTAPASPTVFSATGDAMIAGAEFLWYAWKES